MNELTRRLIERTAQKYRTHALYNDDVFYWHLEEEYWLEVMQYIGIDLKQYVLDEWRIDHPDHFDEEGFLLFIEHDFPLSHKAERMIEEFIARHDEWQLTDYGNYPVEYTERLREEEERIRENNRRRRKAGVTQEQPFLL